MKKEKNKKVVNERKKILISFILLIILIYIFYAIYLLIKEPTDTFTVEEGTLYLEETAVGYIIRDETVIKGNNYKNGMVQIVAEGEKAAKDEAIFRYYSNDESNLTQKIAELDEKIQEAMKNEPDVFSSDIKQIEKQLDEKIIELNKLNDYSKIIEYKKEINNLVTKKAKIAGETSSSGSHIKQLISERSKCEEQLNSGTEYIKTPKSGLISYRVDGLEDVLTTEDFTTLSTEFLQKLDVKTGKIIASSEESGKVINNFECYIAVTLSSTKANEAEVGKSVTIRFSNNVELSAEIVQISKEENDNVLIVLKTDRLTEEMINYRKISFDLVWWSSTGLKVPNQAIVEQDGLNYVVRNRAGYLSKLLVKVLRQNDKYSIVDAYSTDELNEMGYQDISNYKKITIYDEILLKPALEKIK